MRTHSRERARARARERQRETFSGRSPRAARSSRRRREARLLFGCRTLERRSLSIYVWRRRCHLLLPEWSIASEPGFVFGVWGLKVEVRNSEFAPPCAPEVLKNASLLKSCPHTHPPNTPPRLHHAVFFFENRPAPQNLIWTLAFQVWSLGRRVRKEQISQSCPESGRGSCKFIGQTPCKITRGEPKLFFENCPAPQNLVW